MAYDSLRNRQLSPDTCGKEVDVSVSQVHRWIRSGEIVAVQLGTRCTRIDGDSVADFLTRRQAVLRKPRGKAAVKAVAV